jgi:MFS family permease
MEEWLLLCGRPVTLGSVVLGSRSQLPGRWIILLLVNLALFGSHYAYDLPAAIWNPLWRRWEGHMPASTFNFLANQLFSTYSYPNVLFAPMLGGWVADRLGMAASNSVYAAVVLVGQVVFAAGLGLGSSADARTSWGLMLAGRTVFGLGGESFSVTLTSLVARWFAGRETALAMGTFLAMARLGSVVNDVVSLDVAERLGLAWAGWVGVGVCGASLLCALAAQRLDASAEALLSQSAPPCATPEPSRSTDPPGSAETPPRSRFRMSQLASFPPLFWLLTLSCVSTYAAILPFNSVASAYMRVRYGTSDQDSNRLMLILYSVSAALSPPLGAAIDRFGRRASLGAASSAAATLALLYLALTRWPPAGGMVLLGVAYSVYAAVIWPAIALVVPPAHHGTAYGVVTSVQNLGLAVVPFLVAAAMDRCPEDYACVAGALAAVAAAGTLVAAAVGWLSRNGGVLERPAAQSDAIGHGAVGPVALTAPQVEEEETRLLGSGGGRETEIQLVAE